MLRTSNPTRRRTADAVTTSPRRAGRRSRERISQWDRAARDGFTIVEVIVALLLLAVGVLGLAATAGRLHTAVAEAGSEAVAQQMANDRLTRVLLHPRYGELDSLYSGLEDPVAGFEEYRRVTEISRVVETTDDDREIDFTHVTVTVDGPLLSTPVSRAAVVGAP